MVTTLNTCALYGTTSYVNGWLGINMLIILTSLMVVAFAYSLSSFFPDDSRSKLRGVSRFELITALISISIIVVLLGFSLTACTITSTLSQKLSGTSLDPFQYSSYYIGSKFNTGLTLLSNIYAASVTYSISSTIFGTAADLVFYGVDHGLLGKGSLASIFSLGKGSESKGIINLTISKSNVDISSVFDQLSTMYLAVFSPIILVAVGLLFIQYMLLPLMHYAAFTVILPVALAMRAVSFTSSNLGRAANSLIAIAIAMYLIYPMTVAFDSYAVSWVFSSNNPSAQYMNLNYTLSSITPSSFFNSTPSTSTGMAGVLQGTIEASKLIFQSYPANPWTNPLTALFTAPAQFRTYITQMAQFIYVAVLLFVINISITVGLAVGINRALDSALGESARFW